jgi:hypothetical protein
MFERNKIYLSKNGKIKIGEDGSAAYEPSTRVGVDLKPVADLEIKGRTLLTLLSAEPNSVIANLRKYHTQVEKYSTMTVPEKQEFISQQLMVVIIKNRVRWVTTQRQ